MAGMIFSGSPPGKRTEICFNMPPKINSPGILQHPNSPEYFLKYSLPLLELQIAVILVTAYSIYALLKSFGITMFGSQVITGILLGPTFLGRYKFMQEVVFPHDSQELLCTVTYFCYVIYIFLYAVKIDIATTLRSSGKMVIVTGALSFLAPLGIGSAFVTNYAKYLKKDREYSEAAQVVIMNSFSTFSIIVHILDELRVVNTELGLLAISASLVSDVVSLGLTSAIVIFQQTLNPIEMLIGLSAPFAFMLFGGFIVRPMIMKIIRKTPYGSPIDTSITLIIIALACGSAVYFHLFHQMQCVGSFLLGMCIPSGPPFGSTLIEKYETFLQGIFVPICVATSVMRADLNLIWIEFGTIKFYIVIIFFTFVVKLISTMIPSMYWNIPMVDSFVFAIIMTGRGNIELAYYVLARDAKMVSEGVFTLLITYMLINSTFVTVVVRRLYDPSRKYAGYQARNLMCLKPKSELRILACIHKPDNITSFIGLLNAFHPNKQRFIRLYVLNIIQLIGQNTPLLISHKQQKTVSDPRSFQVIVSFSQYQQKNWESVAISTFTALSPSKSMNEDITTLALQKNAMLIVLPLHRRWSIHGSIEAEDSSIRSANCTILEKAPCSVGIFFDRGKLGRGASLETTHSICMIFLGGSDDRETLSLAKRIAQDSSARLTVLHFLSENAVSTSRDAMLDSLALEDFKQRMASNEHSSNSVYKEQRVKDGPETAFAIRSVADDYDLFLVGRSNGVESPQTAGLSAWGEIPELGIIGDLFASRYLSTRAAVLVVQQQKQMM